MASSFPGGTLRLRHESAGRLILPGVVAVGLISAILLLWAIGDLIFAAAFVAVFLALTALILLFGRMRRAEERTSPMLDITLLGAALEQSADAIAITDR